MNELSDAALEDQHCCTCNPIPPLFFYILIPIFLLGLSVSVLILIAVHNALFFVSLLVLSALVIAFMVWNTLQWKSNGAILFFLRSLPQSDLRMAREGQLVKITGVPTLSLFLSVYSFLLMGSLWCAFFFFWWNSFVFWLVAVKIRWKEMKHEIGSVMLVFFWVF
jgi:hypothetical protein